MTMTSAPQYVDRPDGRQVKVYDLTPDAPAGAPVVLFCHAAPGSGDFDPDPAVTAARGVRLIAVDRPGYGGSDAVGDDEFATVALAADDAAAALEAVLAPGATAGVVGWSAGGRVALALAERRPGPGRTGGRDRHARAGRRGAVDPGGEQGRDRRADAVRRRPLPTRRSPRPSARCSTRSPAMPGSGSWASARRTPGCSASRVSPTASGRWSTRPSPRAGAGWWPTSPATRSSRGASSPAASKREVLLGYGAADDDPAGARGVVAAGAAARPAGGRTGGRSSGCRAVLEPGALPRHADGRLTAPSVRTRRNETGRGGAGRRLRSAPPLRVRSPRCRCDVLDESRSRFGRSRGRRLWRPLRRRFAVRDTQAHHDQGDEAGGENQQNEAPVDEQDSGEDGDRDERCGHGAPSGRGRAVPQW